MSNQDYFSNDSFCYAFRYLSGQIDCDLVGKSEASVRERVLKEHMGWRYEHPGRYPQDEKWQELKSFGEIVQVSISVIDA